MTTLQQLDTRTLEGDARVTFTTYTGSTYSLSLNADRTADTIRRVPGPPETEEGTVMLRRDGDAVRLLERPVLHLFESVGLVIDLSVAGVPYTVRTTSAVTSIEVTQDGPAA